MYYVENGRNVYTNFIVNFLYAQREQTMLRLGRGARLVRRYPLLYGLFDEVATVIAKIVIYDRATFAEKDIPGICKLLDSAPPGVRCRA